MPRTDQKGPMLVAGFLMLHINEGTIDDGYTYPRRVRRERQQPVQMAARLDVARVLPEGVASCVGTDPEVWHPESRSRPEEALMRICAGCELREPCLQYAIDNGETGIWAGTTFAERNLLRRVR